jgi:hypothetical protein
MVIIKYLCTNKIYVLYFVAGRCDGSAIAAASNQKRM